MGVVNIKVAREVLEVVDPVYVIEGAGVLLRRSIATATLDYHDPFLLFDHFGSENPRDYVLGFPMHPHRGIETVTYILNGHVDHKDSMGNAGTIGMGDIQWMTSGSGILHEEMPKEPEEGILEGFQLWVNLPKRLKMTEPRYRGVESSQIPKIEHEDGSVIKIIAGEYQGVKGAVTDIYADPTYLDVYLPPESALEIPVKEDHAVLVYVFQGEGIFGDFELDHPQKGTSVKATKMLILGEGNLIKAYAAKEPLRFLIMSGKPLNEPVARYGPFVMNTTEEIEEAIHDLQNNTFIK